MFGGESYDSGSSYVRDRSNSRNSVKEEEKAEITRRPLRKLTEKHLREKLNEFIANPSYSTRIIGNITFSAYKEFLQQQEEIKDDQPGVFSKCLEIFS